MQNYKNLAQVFIPRGNINNDWMLGVFLAVLLIFTVVRLQEPKRLRMLLKVLVSRGSFLDYFALDGNPLSWFNILLNGVFYLTVGLMFYEAATWLDWFRFDLSGFEGFLKIVAILVGYNLIRRVLAYFVGYIVEEYVKVKNYLLFKNLYAHIIGLLVLPLILIDVYGPFDQINLTLIIVGFYGLIQLVAYLRIVYIFVFEYRLISYHLFAYLCALEILPLIVLVKWLLF